VALAIGFEEYLLKPIEPRKVLECVKSILDRDPPPASFEN
jgi:DNA-binding response OmpR family regulator